MAQKQNWTAPALAGGLAGLANGFFGGGGGMILVPLLTGKCGLDQRKAFATSVLVILPLCLLSSVIYLFRGGMEFSTALPYLVGGLVGGAAAGVLSGFGIGGGTLLLVYLTAVAGLDQHLAQGINLLYFLPTAATALPSHLKNGFVETKTAVPAILAGLLGTAAAAWAATALDVSLLRKLFGAYLIYIGTRELFRKKQ